MLILTLGDLFLTYLQNQTGLTIITSMILILLTGFFIGLILFYILKITPLREMSEINYLFSLCVGLFSMLFVIKILDTTYHKEKLNYVINQVFFDNPIVLIENKEQKYQLRYIDDEVKSEAIRTFVLFYDDRVLKVKLTHSLGIEPLQCKYEMTTRVDKTEMFQNKHTILIKEGPCRVTNNKIELLNEEEL